VREAKPVPFRQRSVSQFDQGVGIAMHADDFVVSICLCWS